MKTEFVIRTKRPAQYFRGKLVKHWNQWQVVCLSFAGGGRKESLLNIINFTGTAKSDLESRIKAVAKRGRYIYTTNEKLF